MPDDPLAMQPLGLRCFYNRNELHSTDRYMNGFKALQPESQNLVLFSVIAGVPPDLIEASYGCRNL